MKFASILALAAVMSCAGRPQQAVGRLQPQDRATPSAKRGVGVKQGHRQPPGVRFDLSRWKLTLPVDEDQNGKVDQIGVEVLRNFRHAEFFLLNEQDQMVFTSPNKGFTTPNSRNARSELRQMLRGVARSIKTQAPANNWALAKHPHAHRFAAIGGRMEASLRVTHAPLRSNKPHRRGAYAVVVGQIHAGKNPSQQVRDKGFGWGNEPLKIFYRKLPQHTAGVLFWTYELNLGKGNPNRRDITYPVWGDWQSPADPGTSGIKLGEDFSYVVNVHDNKMQLTFTAAEKSAVHYTLDLSNNLDAYGEPNPDDHPEGYSGDFHYFKAGVYNQCNTVTNGCAGTGDWGTDKQAGDYASAAFTRLVLMEPVPLKQSR